ncbi:MAG: sortase [Propionibacteriaceae bacterium]|nr:sortase [Propionibacteriaceae bacterium]
MSDYQGHEFTRLSGVVRERSVVVPIVRPVDSKELKLALKTAKKVARPKTVTAPRQEKPVQGLREVAPSVEADQSLVVNTLVEHVELAPPAPPVVADQTLAPPGPTPPMTGNSLAVGGEPSETPGPAKTTKQSKEKTATKKRLWSGPLALITTVLILAGGYGGFLASNAVAQSSYSSGMSSPDSLGVLEIPRFGESYGVPIRPEVSTGSLRKGVGWYEGTGQVGDYGNFALAGHRLGWGQPFAQLSMLEVGDEIRVRVGETTFVYRVITPPTIVSHKDAEILAPVPGDPQRRPTKALMTLTTAGSLLPSPDRIVVIGELVTADD